MPRQARSEETVRIIVEAAARILETGGLGAFTTNAVADKAGVSIGSLYQYFPSKQALIGALIVRETSHLIADCQSSLAQPTGEAALDGLIASAVSHQLKRPVLARLLDVEEARMPLDAHTHAVGAQLRAILRDALARIDPNLQDTIDVAAQDVMAIIKGMVDAAGEQDERDPARLFARVRRAVCGYLGIGGNPMHHRHP